MALTVILKDDSNRQVAAWEYRELDAAMAWAQRALTTQEERTVVRDGDEEVARFALDSDGAPFEIEAI